MLNTVSLLDFVSEEQIQNYSVLPEIQDIARNALAHTNEIFPIYVLSMRVNEKLQDTTVECLTPLIRFWREYELILNDRFHIVCSTKDAQAYLDQFDDIFDENILSHDYNSIKYKGVRITPKIRNLILTDCYYKYCFMFDDDVILQRLYDTNTVKDCLEPSEVLITFAIWQYMTLKEAASKIINYNPIAISGMPVVNNLINPMDTYHDKKNYPVLINDTRLCQAVLLNVDVLKTYQVEYFEDYPIWEDFDILCQIAKERLNNVSVLWPIHYRENRKMMSTDSACSYGDGKLTHLSANLFRKWGFDIVQHFIPTPQLLGEVNVKLGNFNQLMIKYPLTKDEKYKQCCADLDILEETRNTEEFLAKWGKDGTMI